MIKVGCAGFPISQSSYHRQFGVVETADFYDKIPQQKTLSKWRRNAPTHFEFVSCALNKISYFPSTNITREAFKQSVHAADILNARMIVFRFKKNMAPNADNASRLQNLFNVLPPRNRLYVWNVPLSWPRSMVERLSKSCHIIPSINPLIQKPYPNFPIQYFHVSNKRWGRNESRLNQDDLRQVKQSCVSHKLNYVIMRSGPHTYQNALDFTRFALTS